MDLADGRVLGEQLALTPTELAHVAQEQDRARALSTRGQWDGSQGHARATRLDLGAPRRPPGHDQCETLVHRRLVAKNLGDDPGQRGPDDVTDVTEAMDGRDGVRARVGHRPVGVEANHAVADPRRATTLAGGGGEAGELP